MNEKTIHCMRKKFIEIEKNTFNIRRIRPFFLIEIDKNTKLLTIRVADGTLAPFLTSFYNF